MSLQRRFQKPIASTVISFLGPRMMSPKKAAEYLGMSVDLIYEMIKRRELPVVPKGKNGQQYNIDRCDLDRWIDKNKIDVAA
jgi:excisionase family DNA binding protein